MRYAVLPFMLLAEATFLVILHISLGSPVNHDNSIGTYSVLALLVDNSSPHAVPNMAAGAEGYRHFQRKSYKLDLGSQPSTALIQRHSHTIDNLRLTSGSSSLAKRSLAGDLTVMGFKLIWEYADVIVSSSLAYYRTTELYRNLTILTGDQFKVVGPYAITYGVFRLTFYPAADVATFLAAELADSFPNGFGQFVREFAEVMISLTTFVVLGTFRVLALGALVSIWITLAVVENAPQQDMITAP